MNVRKRANNRAKTVAKTDVGCKGVGLDADLGWAPNLLAGRWFDIYVDLEGGECWQKFSWARQINIGSSASFSHKPNTRGEEESASPKKEKKHQENQKYSHCILQESAKRNSKFLK